MKDKTKLKILTTILIIVSFFVLKAMDVDDRVLASLGIFDSFYGDIVVTDNISLDNIPEYEAIPNTMINTDNNNLLIYFILSVYYIVTGIYLRKNQKEK